MTGVREMVKQLDITLEEWQITMFERWQEAPEAGTANRAVFSLPRRRAHGLLAELIDYTLDPVEKVVRDTVEAAYSDGETPIYGLDADEVLERHSRALRERLATEPVRLPPTAPGGVRRRPSPPGDPWRIDRRGR